MTDALQPFTPTNFTSGAGVIDSWHNVELAAEEIRTAHGGDQAAVAVELGIATVSAVLDTVAFALDPLAKLIAAGLGWLIEHVKFLRWPLDQLAGNPDQIKLLAESLHRIGQDLRNTADDLDQAMHRVVTGWQGAGQRSFDAEMTAHREHVAGSGRAVDTAGYVVETTMALIVAVRGLIRDIVTTLIADIIATMLIALALAAITFGASIPVAVGKCVAEAAVQVTAMVAKLAKVTGFAGRAAGRLHQLTGLTKAKPAPHPTPHPTPHLTPHLTPPPTRPSSPGTTTSEVRGIPAPRPVRPAAAEAESLGIRATDEPFATWLAADRHFNGPAPAHAATPGAPATRPAWKRPASESAPVPVVAEPRPASSSAGSSSASSSSTASSTAGSSSASSSSVDSAKPPTSLLRPYDVRPLKAHEEYFKRNYSRYWHKNKYFENLVRARFPGAFPVIKALSDAKTGKNFVGWAGKGIVNVDRSLTDIGQQTEAGWAQSDANWRTGHPGPSATEGAGNT